MKDFFKFTFASCLGVFLSLIALFFVLSIVVSKSIASTNKAKTVASNTILKVDLSDPIPEHTNNTSQSGGGLMGIPTGLDAFDDKDILGLHDIIDAIETAKDDPKIKGMFLNLKGLPSGLASIELLRDAIVDFRTGGKFVHGYGDYVSQGSYYLLTASDKITVNPLGALDFRGFGAVREFYKGTLDKLGVKMNFYYAGQYKSATEPFRLTKMSKQNKLQTREYLSELHERFLSKIGEGRELSSGVLKDAENEWLTSNLDAAKDAGLIDEVGYEDQVYSALRDEIGFDDDDKLVFTNINDYHRSAVKGPDFTIKNKLAVVFAEGTIIDGDEVAGSTAGDHYAGILRKIRRDDKIKAVVLRVNSGGGSALASEKIWREVGLLKEKGVPVITSMSDYAASGGYYIACNSDKIYSQANTLTGSIGVFRGLPDVSEMYNRHLGITHDTIKTGDLSAGLTPFLPPSSKEQFLLQRGTDEMYQTFLKRVSDGRDMDVDAVHKIAQGRVWTGTKAKDLGLVDEIGGIEDAISFAAEKADIKSYRLTKYPRSKNAFQRLMDDLIDPSARTEKFLEENLKDHYQTYKDLKSIQDMEGYQMRMPYKIVWN